MVVSLLPHVGFKPLNGFSLALVFIFLEGF